MEPERLSDAELLELARAGGESGDAAQIELTGRHFGAVRKMAGLCVTDDAAAHQLAEHAWRLVLWPQDTGEDGALRPRALSSVLQAAAEVAHTNQWGALDANLAEWLRTRLAALDYDPSSGDATIFHGGSAIWRAFYALPANLQTVMWHQVVEHSDSGWIGRLLGSELSDPREIPTLTRRAYRDFYDAYERISHEGMTDDCRRFHRMVMAYADHRGGNTAAVIPHLQECAHCSRTVADLEGMYANFGGLLVDAVLPWGGQAYAATRRAEWVSAPIAVHGEERADAPRGDAGEAVFPDSPDPEEHGGVLGRARWGALARAGVAERKASGSRGRAGRITLVAGVLGVCSLVAAFVYAQESGSSLPQRSGEPPAKKVPSVPAPSKSGEPGTSGSIAGSSSPTDSASGSRRQPSDDRDRRTSGPSVPDAALEWLFDETKDGETDDSSGNGEAGKLIGNPPPKPLKDGGVSFFGQQSVTSQDPVLDTDSSFSVSARVKLRNKDEYQTVASQDGAEVSSFQLQFDPVEDRWEMRMHREDEQTSAADEAESDAAPRAGRWTALAGVYDAPEGLIRLYVDGKLQDTVHREGDRSSEGDFAVGRARLGDQFVRGFEGTIKDVRAFPKALTGAQVRKLAGEK
ncbi:LamG domain-containing protein [Streptomyces winkii]|uniref:LamG domain-containing protein n=1 Tax=Streptomyces winkii TaxID=3051178 RepID=UPI0028D18B9E|nr:LamG domain-containing protein [Streptomyces sp. DSM 40971]